MIYFIQEEQKNYGGLVKIGYSANYLSVKSRLKSLQTANGRKLSLRAVLEESAYGMERAIHEHFHHLKQEGEWFEYDGELAELIRWAYKNPKSSVGQIRRFLSGERKGEQAKRIKEIVEKRITLEIEAGDITVDRVGSLLLKRDHVCPICGEVAVEGERGFDVGKDEMAHVSCSFNAKTAICRKDKLCATCAKMILAGDPILRSGYKQWSHSECI